MDRDLSREVLEIIERHAPKGPIVSKEIEFMLGVKGPLVRDAIRALRRSGIPVVAITHKKKDGDKDVGYFIATRPEEVLHVISDLSARIASMSETVRALKQKAFERFRGQITFDYFDRPGSPEVPGTLERGATGHDTPGSRAGQDVLSVQVDNRETAQGVVHGDGEDKAPIHSLLDELIG